jgi:hypothetical protein
MVVHYTGVWSTFLPINSSIFLPILICLFTDCQVLQQWEIWSSEVWQIFKEWVYIYGFILVTGVIIDWKCTTVYVFCSPVWQPGVKYVVTFHTKIQKLNITVWYIWKNCDVYVLHLCMLIFLNKINAYNVSEQNIKLCSNMKWILTGY